MITSLPNIKIRMHVIDNSNNEIRGSGVKRDVGGDEKQLIKFSRPYYVHKGMLLAMCFTVLAIDDNIVSPSSLM